jgi:5-methylcytosine-specific restriction endonuclease McrA
MGGALQKVLRRRGSQEGQEIRAFTHEVTDEDIRKQRAIARQMRETAWWKRKRSRGVCYYCNIKVLPESLTMDHLIPLSRGGKSVRSNIVTACKTCNNKKKYSLPFEWEEYMMTIRG